MSSSSHIEHFSYDNKTVRNFGVATIIWGIVGMSVGVLVAFQLFAPAANLGNHFHGDLLFTSTPLQSAIVQ
jgi:cytochrome c oxidase cbb3-type subunit I/II